MTGTPPPQPEVREQLEKLSVPELKKLAAAHDIAGRSQMKKSELVDALEPILAEIEIVLAPLEDAATISDRLNQEELEGGAETKDFDADRRGRDADPVSAPESQVVASHPAPQKTDTPDPANPAGAAERGPKRVTAQERRPSLKRRITAHTVTIGSLYERDGTRMPMMGKATFALVVLYLILNRLISDRMVLPIGISLRVYEVVLILVGIAWFLWMLDEPLPLPYGPPAITGLILVVLVGIAPFIHSPGFNAYQANGAERGLFRMFMFVALFLAAYHIAFRRRPGLVLLGIIIAATAGQALFAVYEFVTERPVELLDNIALGMGLIPDPLSIRSDDGDVFQRLTGEIRAVATAPHPIILSGVIAVAALIVGMWIINVRTKRARRWLALVGLILFLGLPLANSRTGFVIIVALVLPLLLLATPKLPSLIQWSLPVMFAMVIAFAVSPETPRLLLNSFTDPGSDPNTQIRVERIERLPELTAERPFLGAGYLTHDPEIQIFDNGYNLGLVELGILGLAAFLAFVVTSLVRCWTGSIRAGPEEVILPIAGVIAALALLAGGGTFDAWTFDQFFPTCITLLGLGLGRSAVVLRRDAEEEIVVHRPELVDA